MALFVSLPFFSAEASAEPVRFQSDFDAPDAASRWEFVRGDWRLTSGLLEQTDPRAAGTLARPKDLVCDDFELRCDFKVVAGGQRVAQVAFRVQGNDTYYYVHFDGRGSQVMLVMRVPEQPWNEIARTTDVKLPFDTWNEARIVSEGPGIRVYLNGKLVIEALDDTFLGGGFGLGTSQGHVQFKRLSIRGQAADMEQGHLYQSPPFTIVCEDAGAGADEEFPDVARLENGDLICVFYAGYAHGSRPSPRLPRGGRIAMVRSRDNGKTWTPAETLFDSPLDDRDPSICEIEPGRLLCNFFSYHYPDPAKGILATAETYVIESRDGGQTWGQPRLVESPFDGSCSTSDPIHQLADGTLLLPVYGYRKEKPYHYIPAVLRSVDAGRTWGDPSLIVPDYPEPLTEPALCSLPDGRILCHIRPIMLQCLSSDGGRTWTPPERLPFRGDAPYLLRTSRGVLLSAFRHPGTSIAYSLDQGRTWHGPQRLDICAGAYPSMVELPDGTIFFVYYSGGVGSDIRALRLRADADGVDVLEQEG